MIYTTKKITLMILLKTNGCKRLKMRHFKIHRTRKYSYPVNLINTCIHRAVLRADNIVFRDAYSVTIGGLQLYSGLLTL